MNSRAGDGPSEDRPSNDRRSRPFDAGLQPERTALAWRRTALALVGAALVGVRVLPTLLGPWATAPAAAGIVLALVVLISAHRRYLVQHARLTSSDSARVALPGGGLPALVALSVFIAGVACALVVVSRIQA